MVAPAAEPAGAQEAQPAADYASERESEGQTPQQQQLQPGELRAVFWQPAERVKGSGGSGGWAGQQQQQQPWDPAVGDAGLRLPRLSPQGGQQLQAQQRPGPGAAGQGAKGASDSSPWAAVGEDDLPDEALLEALDQAERRLGGGAQQQEGRRQQQQQQQEECGARPGGTAGWGAASGRHDPLRCNPLNFL